ncbi:HAD-IA family hydrolase [Planctomycetota bacterium]|nr:HAD-IA family hydrolase [Planctomycetota bacterium]
MIRAIIFDMDGVLCDSEPFIIQAASKMFKDKYRVEVQPTDFLPFTGTGEASFIGGVANKYGVALELEADKGITYQNYIEMIRGKLAAYPGVRTFVNEAEKQGLKVAVASSADVIKVRANLEQIGLKWDEFEVVVTGSDVTKHKPNPECFIKAADMLGEKYEDCLVVEDAVAGVQAGKAAGCKVLGLMTSFEESALRSAGADWVATDLGSVTVSAVSW